MAFEACEFFDVKPGIAKQEANAMAKLLADRWKQALREEGTSGDDIRLYADAFEHAAAEEAMNLDA